MTRLNLRTTNHLRLLSRQASGFLTTAKMRRRFNHLHQLVNHQIT